MHEKGTGEAYTQVQVQSTHVIDMSMLNVLTAVRSVLIAVRSVQGIRYQALGQALTSNQTTLVLGRKPSTSRRDPEAPTFPQGQKPQPNSKLSP